MCLVCFFLCFFSCFLVPFSGFLWVFDQMVGRFLGMKRATTLRFCGLFERGVE